MRNQTLLAMAALGLLNGCSVESPNQNQSETTPAGTATAEVAIPMQSKGRSDAARPAAFANCAACHPVTQAHAAAGPSLFGVMGRKAGSMEGYNFSPALRNSGVTWDREKLDIWLQGPMKMVPGTRMVMAVPDAERRKAIIDYLETLN